MGTDHKTLTTENGWLFRGNQQHESPRPYPYQGTLVHHGCLYPNDYRGLYLYQWGFDDRGNASHEQMFHNESEMNRFFKEH